MLAYSPNSDASNTVVDPIVFVPGKIVLAVAVEASVAGSVPGFFPSWARSGLLVAKARKVRGCGGCENIVGAGGVGQGLQVVGGKYFEQLFEADIGSGCFFLLFNPDGGRRRLFGRRIAELYALSGEFET